MKAKQLHLAWIWMQVRAPMVLDPLFTKLSGLDWRYMLPKFSLTSGLNHTHLVLRPKSEGVRTPARTPTILTTQPTSLETKTLELRLPHFHLKTDILFITPERFLGHPQTQTTQDKRALLLDNNYKVLAAHGHYKCWWYLSDEFYRQHLKKNY